MYNLGTIKKEKEIKTKITELISYLHFDCDYRSNLFFVILVILAFFFFVYFTGPFLMLRFTYFLRMWHI